VYLNTDCLTDSVVTLLSQAAAEKTSTIYTVWKVPPLTGQKRINQNSPSSPA